MSEMRSGPDVVICGFPSPMAGAPCVKPVGHEGSCTDRSGSAFWLAKSVTAQAADDYYRGYSTRNRIRKVLGPLGFAAYCLGNVIKYGSRLGRKPGASIESDRTKLLDYADWAAETLAELQAQDHSNSRSSHNGGSAAGTSED